MEMLLGILFGAVGTAYLVYAKRQFSASFAWSGAALVLYPFFISNTVAVLLLGSALVAAPFIARRYS